MQLTSPCWPLRIGPWDRGSLRVSQIATSSRSTALRSSWETFQWRTLLLKDLLLPRLCQMVTPSWLRLKRWKKYVSYDEIKANKPPHKVHRWDIAAVRVRKLTPIERGYRLEHRLLFVDAASEVIPSGCKTKAKPGRAQGLRVYQLIRLGIVSTLRQHRSQAVGSWHSWWSEGWDVLSIS